MKISRNQKYVMSLAVVVPVILLISGIFAQKTSHNELAGPTYTVKKGPLTISFVESGTIKARDQIILKNEVEGRTTITYVIPEGTRVKKGDLLIELDVSNLENEKIDKEIDVQNAEAAYISAKENLAVVENQAKSDVDLAILKLEFAKQDLDKYINGDYQNELHKAEAAITLNKEKFARANDTLIWSEKLAAENFISNTELQGDRLAKDEAEMNVRIAERDKELLTQYTYKRKLAELQSDVNQAEMALERTKRKSNADIIQAQATLNAKKAEYERQKDKLEKILTQISKTKIYAPEDGLVIYATSARNTGGWRGSRDEPLDVGKEVSEREELIYLPTGNAVDAEIMVHEAYLKKLSLGMPTVITVDALPGRRFYGTIRQIAPLPDARSMWMNPDLKLYPAKISIESEDPMLRSGMSCQAEIIVQQLKEAIYVPLQTVIRVGQQPTVFVKKGKSFESRAVKIGLDNNKVIHIIEGLNDNDVVLLNPPLKSAAVYTKTSEEYGDDIGEKINDGLKNVENQAAAPAIQTDETQTPNIDKIRKKLENMTPEQIAAMKEKFEKASPEEKERMMREFGISGKKHNKEKDEQPAAN